MVIVFQTCRTHENNLLAIFLKQLYVYVAANKEGSNKWKNVRLDHFEFWT
jgi:hypothetical protein